MGTITFVGHADGRMCMKVFTNAWQGVDHLKARALNHVGLADARQLQQLRACD